MVRDLNYNEAVAKTSNTQDVVYEQNCRSTHSRVKELMWPARPVLYAIFIRRLFF